MISAAADTRTTIVAIASSSAPALRGIVRIAGEDAVGVLAAMASGFVAAASTRPYRIDVSLELGAPLGRLAAAALVWPTSRSYTGSPSVELHTFGSPPLLEAVVAAAVRAGARPAGPGEFTMRAFLAGRIDLTQAEAVLGVIDAADRDQLDAALDQLAGNVSRPLRAVRDRLLDLLADIEAGLDFVDEDIRFIEDESVLSELSAAAEVIGDAKAQLTGRHRAIATVDIILRGLPNVGKSSLLNALAGETVAIVSDEAGTTRDVVWHEFDIEGRPVRLIDTAGQEEPRDEIMRESQRVARDSQRTAAITLVCVDADAALGLDPRELRRGRGPDGTADETSCDRFEDTNGVSARFDGTGWLPVATRCDLLERPDLLADAGWLVTSGLERQGLANLRQAIAEELDRQFGMAERGVSATAARCGDSIVRAERAIGASIDAVRTEAGHEWVAGEIRVALAAIGEVTGEIYTDDILDRVFSRFCIGK